MNEVTVKNLPGDKNLFKFEVTVSDSNSETKHTVIMDSAYYKKLKTKTIPSDIIKKTFHFLLAREPKESILKEFNIRIISNFFYEFEEDSKTY